MISANEGQLQCTVNVPELVNYKSTHSRLEHLCIYHNTTVIATIVLFTVNDDKIFCQLQKKHCYLIVIGCIMIIAIHSNRHHKLNQNKIITLIIRHTTGQENIFKIVSRMIRYQQNHNILVQIGDICIIWIALNRSNIIWNHKLYTNRNGGNKMNKNGIVHHTLIRTITIMFMHQDCDEFRAQASIYVFMLLFKFNCSHDKDLLLFYSMAMKTEDFGLIVAVINSSNTIIVQVDYRCEILIVIINE